MTKTFIIVIALFLSSNSYCQKDNNLTGYSKASLKKTLEKYMQETDLKSSYIHETDTTLLLSIRDAGVSEVDFYYHFDKTGKCDVEKKLTKCTSCLAGYLKAVLKDKEFNWIKINEQLYLSKYSKKRKVEIVDDQASCPYIKITRVNWRRPEYKKVQLSNVD